MWAGSLAARLQAVFSKLKMRFLIPRSSKSLANKILYKGIVSKHLILWCLKEWFITLIRPLSSNVVVPVSSVSSRTDLLWFIINLTKAEEDRILLLTGEDIELLEEGILLSLPLFLGKSLMTSSMSNWTLSDYNLVLELVLVDVGKSSLPSLATRYFMLDKTYLIILVSLVVGPWPNITELSTHNL